MAEADDDDCMRNNNLCRDRVSFQKMSSSPSLSLIRSESDFADECLHIIHTNMLLIIALSTSAEVITYLPVLLGGQWSRATRQVRCPTGAASGLNGRHVETAVNLYSLESHKKNDVK